MTLLTQDSLPADMESCPERVADSLPVLPRGSNDRIPGWLSQWLYDTNVLTGGLQINKETEP